ncbi:MAG: RNA methyltransferase [Candidatus Nanopelagicales bacterium]
MTSNGPTSVRSDRVGAVRRLANRSFRHKVGRFLAEGPQSVREAVRHRPDVIDEIFVIPDASADIASIIAEATAAGLRITPIPEPVLLAMTETVHPQGIAAVCRFLDADDPAALMAGASLVAVLHQVRDPGNAGTILRTADAAGADLVVLTGDSVDPYNGKCVRSTAGSLFHVPYASLPLEQVAHVAGESGLTVLAADGDAPESLPEVVAAGVLAGRIAWVFGNEAHGLPGDVPCDRRVSIPLYGSAESLNLAGAAAVCLYTTAMAQHSPALPG